MTEPGRFPKNTDVDQWLTYSALMCSNSVVELNKLSNFIRITNNQHNLLFFGLRYFIIPKKCFTDMDLLLCK